MTDSNKTLIGILVDRSGSMHRTAQQMTEAIAEFITGQSRQPGLAEVTLAEFDQAYKLVYPRTPISEVPEYTLIPRGSTALHDAIGRFVTDVGENLSAQPESDRPGKVIIVIITDGYENASTKWGQTQVRKLIQQQRDDYNWEFIFLGANIDAVMEAKKFGIAADSALTYSYAAAPLAMTVMSRYVTSTRAGDFAQFSASDRRAAMGD